MKFAAFLLPMLGLSVAAEKLSIKARRDVSTILDTLQNIQKITASLDDAINAYTGGDPKPIIDGSHKLIQSTTAGAEAINAIDPISLNDAVKVQNFVKTLQTQVQKTITDLVGKKEVAKSNNLGGITYDQLQQQYKGADAISQAITAKVPDNLKAVAQQLSKGILDSVQKGVDAYADIKDQKAPAGLDTPTAAAGGAAAGGAAAGGAAAGNGTAATGGAAAAGSNSTMPMTTSTGARVTNAAAAAAPSATPSAGAMNLKPAGALAAVAIAVLAL